MDFVLIFLSLCFQKCYALVKGVCVCVCVQMHCFLNTKRTSMLLAYYTS